MKKILAFFKQRWVISLIGVLIIALLIWFIGPWIGIAGREPLASPVWRLVVILVIVLIWGVNNLRRQMKANKANDQMIDGITEAGAEGAGPDHRAEEVAILRERFEEAMAVLKKSRGKKGDRANLYDLPWYVIIGPPGSGKTTALVNSGLDFPLAERFGKEALRGVGGTRNCDWWFTNEAILLDTAGRFTTQDSDAAVDSAAWTGFLDLLKRYRRRRPINGVIVAISLSDLMIQNEQERNAQVYAIKQRVQELYQHFKVRFPIYVLLTKCDLVAGFMEFFDDLGHDERMQVWGSTFPLEDGDLATGSVERFGAELDALLERLNARLLARMSQERDLRRRSAIYAFPRQIAALKQSLEQFLQDTFRPSRFEDPPLLRGFYLTSGTQEGTPIDRLMGSVARTFGLDQQVLPSFGGQGRSYFITAFLRQVVFGESELAGANRRLERQRAWLQRGAYAGTTILAVVAALAWLTSYARNSAYVEEVDEDTGVAAELLTEVPPESRDVLEVLPVLNAIREIPGGEADADEGTPFLMGLGLYQGDKLGSEAQRAYRRVLTNEFLPRIMFRFEEQMQLAPTPDYQFEALKAYLMLGDEEHFDADYLREWVAWDWEQSLPRQTTAEQREQLVWHLDTLLANGPLQLPIAADAELVRRTQRTLAGVRPAARVFGQIKRAPEARELPEFRVSSAAGPDGPSVFTRRSGDSLNEGIPGLFTYDGFYEFFLAEAATSVAQFAKEGWVLGDYQPDLGDADNLTAEVIQLYEREYAERWESLLGDLEIIPFSSFNHAVEILNIVSGPTSPIRNLLAAVNEHTRLDEPPIPVDQAAAVADKATAGVRQRFRRLGVDAPSASAAVDKGPGVYVAKRFERLNRLTGEPLDNILMQVDALYLHLNAIARSGDPRDSWRAQERGSEIVNDLSNLADRQPEPLDRWLRSLAGEATSLTAGGVRRHLGAAYGNDVLPFCKQAIANRYPFVPTSPREVTLEDFGKFFGPGGDMDSFFDTYLKESVDTTRDPWRLRGSEAPVSAATLAQFQRAARIRDAFFRGGGKEPAVRFELKPLGMDRDITRFQLDIEGQQVSYAHGPQRPYALQWPGTGGPKQVRIQISPPSPAGRSGISEDGDWAWFRILDGAAMVPSAQPERFDVTFDIDGRRARFELWPSSVENPFNLTELEKFRCPEKL